MARRGGDAAEGREAAGRVKVRDTHGTEPVAGGVVRAWHGPLPQTPFPPRAFPACHVRVT